jgi:PHD/YefM family antitoxin component YafN of YafNO toxin-antitoxin module
MKLINVTELRKDIYNIVDQISEKNEPLLISGKRNNAVLISETDWNSLNETIYLMSNKDLKESIIKGLNTPITDCSDKIDW